MGIPFAGFGSDNIVLGEGDEITYVDINLRWKQYLSRPFEREAFRHNESTREGLTFEIGVNLIK